METESPHWTCSFSIFIFVGIACPKSWRFTRLAMEKFINFDRSPSGYSIVCEVFVWQSNKTLARKLISGQAWSSQALQGCSVMLKAFRFVPGRKQSETSGTISAERATRIGRLEVSKCILTFTIWAPKDLKISALRKKRKVLLTFSNEVLAVINHSAGNNVLISSLSDCNK